LLDFLVCQDEAYLNQYTLDGQPLSADHSTGLAAMAAVAAMVADPEIRTSFVATLWEVPTPSGTWRYSDGLPYFMGLLQASSHFKTYNLH
jgi:oligosaccharide reducing-end xylanase